MDPTPGVITAMLPLGMGLQKRLDRWRAAGLLDEATAQRILAFEKQGHGPSALFVVAVLGGLTVGLGCISLVAANWDQIAGRSKIGVDLFLLIGLAIALIRARARWSPTVFDVLVVMNYLMVLASLALVGQVYQLGTPIYVALVAWSLATTPLLLLAHSLPVAYLWLAGIVTTYATTIEPAANFVQQWSGSNRVEAATVLFCLFAAPLLMQLASRTLHRHAAQPSQALAFADGARIAAWLGASVSTLIWYADLGAGDREEAQMAVVATAIPTALALAFTRRLWPSASFGDKMRGPVMFAFAWSMLAVGASFERGEWPVLGALSQLALLGLWAWAAWQEQRARAFGVLTAMIAARILIVYFEVFGSLLSTGIGLMSGGLLTLGLAYAWHRIGPRLRSQGRQPAKGEPS